MNIYNKKEEYVLAIDELAGGTANDYYDHVVSSVEYSAWLYSEWYAMYSKQVICKFTIHLFHGECAIIMNEKAHNN